MREKRKSGRVSFEVPVKVSVGSTSFDAQTKDISIGGMLIKSNHLPTVGSKAVLYFTIDTLSVKVNAFIRWRTDTGFGVQFDLMGAHETRAINNVINHSKA